MPGGVHTPTPDVSSSGCTRSRAGTPPFPEDLASDAWLTAADKIGSFEGSSSEFAGYSFGIACLLALNDRRRAGRRRTSAADPADLTAMSPTTEPIREIEDMSWIRSRLAAPAAGAGRWSFASRSSARRRHDRHRPGSVLDRGPGRAAPGLRKLRAGHEPTPGTILPTV